MELALTITRKRKTISGNMREKHFQIAFDSSYPTGGEPLTAANLGMRKLTTVSITGQKGYTFEYDYTNEKILAYQQGAQTSPITITDSDTAASTGVAVYFDEDAATEAAKLLFVSPTDTDGSVTPTVATVAPGQVGSTVDLSAITDCRVVVTGK
jgi:hypothetical protein